MPQFILLEESEGIATLTFNRPEKLNAITNAMEVEMFEALSKVKQNKDVRMLIITAPEKRSVLALTLRTCFRN